MRTYASMSSAMETGAPRPPEGLTVISFPTKRADHPAAVAITISALSKATGASSRALRHYEDLGLLTPTRTHGNGRRYTPQQCARAALIVFLRRCDVSLADLPRLIDAERPEGDRLRDLEDVLERKAVELAERLDEVRAVLDARPEWGRIGLAQIFGALRPAAS